MGETAEPQGETPETDARGRRVAALFEQLPEMIVVIDPTGLIVDVNQRLLDTMGYTIDEALGANIFEFVHPDDLAYMAWSWEQREANPGEIGILVHARGRNSDGSWRAVEILGLSLLDHPDVAGMVMTMRDLAAEDTTQPDSPARLRSMVDRTTDVMLLVDETGLISYANRRLTSRYGHDSDRVLGRELASILHPDDTSDAAHWLQGLITSGDRSSSRVRLRVVDPSGESHDVEWHGTNQIGDPLIAGIILSGRDITDLVAMETQVRTQTEQLEHAAAHDPLTGLLNRGAFIDQVTDRLETWRSDGGDRDTVVLFCDLDRFKYVNDTYGHEVGDRVLEVVAARLRASVRSDDLVGRYGGDEFTVLLGEQSTPAATTALVARIKARIAEPIAVGEVIADVGVTVGVSRLPAMEARVDALLREADHAMYAKKADRDRGSPPQPTPHG